MLFSTALRGASVSSPTRRSLFLLRGTGDLMPTTKVLRQRLQGLGWRLLGDAQQAPDTSWYLLCQSAGHTIVALAETQYEVWSAASSMAIKLTRECHGRSEFVP